MEKPNGKPELIDAAPSPLGQPLRVLSFNHLRPARYREKLRNLPLPEKVRIVVELQKIAAPILRARGEKPIVWELNDREPLTERGKK